MKVAIFIDGKNFYNGWRDATGSSKLDFSRMSRWLAEQVTESNAEIFGSFYYTSVYEGSDKLMGFLEMLESRAGFFVKRLGTKTGYFTCNNCKHENRTIVEKEVDTSIVADMVRLAAVGAYDTAVLVSGDVDFAPAVEAAQSFGRRVYVATWGRGSLSGRLRSVCFGHIDMNDGFETFKE